MQMYGGKTMNLMVSSMIETGIVLVFALVCVFIVFVIVTLLCKVFVKFRSAEENEVNSMFEVVEDGDLYYVVYHKLTNVMYTVSGNGEFTVMVNVKGEPLIYSKEDYAYLEDTK